MRVLPNLVNNILGLVLFAGGAAYAANPPADPIQKTTPHCVTPTNDQAVEGRRAYLRMNCYSCHGMAGKGGMGPNIVKAESGDVREAIMEGEEGGMPSFKNNLCPNDIANIATYLRLLGTGTEPTFVNWWEGGPGLPSR
jgi:mono/diheme cytochrome c family protein